MSQIFVVSDNIVSPLGSTTADNFDQLRKNISGIRRQTDPAISTDPFYASLIPESITNEKATPTEYTRFERLLLLSMTDAIQRADIDPSSSKTIFIISTTKGNISLLETEPVDAALEKRIALHQSAQLMAAHFKSPNKPVIVSHACISGSLAIITGMRMLESGMYENAVIGGADLISRFVLSGFQSFQAISAEPCKPFDADRNGITLGEAAATIILSTKNKVSGSPQLLGGAVTNDANHISGPSRTGEELFLAMNRAVKTSGIGLNDIDFISAHGTATIYNDEMEAKAISLGSMENIPVNSLKGFYGHTLGAAGLIESIVSLQSLKDNLLLPTLGFTKAGTSKSIGISNQTQYGDFRHFLKTASGFGGCNAAVVFKKSI